MHIETMYGSDGFWWWTNKKNPTMADWYGIPPCHSRGFDTQAEAVAAAAYQRRTAAHTFDEYGLCFECDEQRQRG